MKLNRFRYVAFCLLLVLLSLLLFHKQILIGAGRFMAPTSEGKAEALIVEGNAVVTNGAIHAGVRLLAQGRANRMVVVLLQPLKESEQVFGHQGKYDQLVADELERLGVGKERVRVISIPISGHPITLTEARSVVAELCRDHVRNAILLSNGFHTLRSVGLYRQEGIPAGLRVIPYAYFAEDNNGSWWRDPQGVGDFMTESAKLLYYVLRGYLGVKYLRSG